MGRDDGALRVIIMISRVPWYVLGKTIREFYSVYFINLELGMGWE
jgi:hypothetical protein